MSKMKILLMYIKIRKQNTNFNPSSSLPNIYEVLRREFLQNRYPSINSIVKTSKLSRNKKYILLAELKEKLFFL